MANINNLKTIIGDCQAIMFHAPRIATDEFRYNWNSWEVNLGAGHDISLSNYELVIKKFRPNQWIIRTPQNEPNAELCKTAKNLSLKISGISRYSSDIFTTPYYANGAVWGDGGTSGSIKGLGVLPYCTNNNAVSAFGGEMPFAAYVWDGCTYTNGNTVQLGSETTAFRGDYGIGYNGYGKTKDSENVLVFPDLASFPCPWNSWRLAIGLYTMSTFSFDRYKANGTAKINDSFNASIYTRNDVNATSPTTALWTQEKMSSMLIRVTGLQEGDYIKWSHTSAVFKENTYTQETVSQIDKDFEYLVTNNGVDGGFVLYGDTANTSEVKIEIINRDKDFLTEDGLIDVSDNPIVISMLNEGKGINVTTRECWDAHLGDNVIYHKDKTVDNCWVSHGIAEKGLYEEIWENDMMVGRRFIEHTENIYAFDNHTPIADYGSKQLFYIPTAIDWKEKMTGDMIQLSDDKDAIQELIPNQKYYEYKDNKYYTYKPISWRWEDVENDPSLNAIELQDDTSYYISEYNNGVLAYSSITPSLGATLVAPLLEKPENSILISQPYIYYTQDKNNLVETFTKRRVIEWEITESDECPSGGILWQCNHTNTELWEDVREFYANDFVIRNGYLHHQDAWKGCNLGGALHVTFGDGADFYAHDFIAKSNIEEVHITSIEGHSFTSCNTMFRHAGELTAVTSNTPMGSNDFSGMFEFCGKLQTYPSNLIGWGKFRGNLKALPEGNSLFGYTFEYCGSLKTIPSYSDAPTREDDLNVIVPAGMTQTFNGCGNLETIGPVIDFIAIQPNTDATYLTFNNCNALVDCRFKNLNHGDWKFDGSSDTNYHAYFPNLNQASITYLFNNVVDLYNRVNADVDDSLSSRFTQWNGAVHSKYNTCYFSELWLRYRHDNNATLPKITSELTATSGIVEGLSVIVEGMKSTDVIWFGNASRTSGQTVTLADLGNMNGLRTYTFRKDNVNANDPWAFYLLTNNTSDMGDAYEETNQVKFTIISPFNPYIANVDEAALYCPETWRNKITSTMLDNIQAKGWKVYVGGLLLDSVI